MVFQVKDRKSIFIIPHLNLLYYKADSFLALIFCFFDFLSLEHNQNVKLFSKLQEFWRWALLILSIEKIFYFTSKMTKSTQFSHKKLMIMMHVMTNSNDVKQNNVCVPTVYVKSTTGIFFTRRHHCRSSKEALCTRKQIVREARGVRLFITIVVFYRENDEVAASSAYFDWDYGPLPWNCRTRMDVS